MGGARIHLQLTSAMPTHQHRGCELFYEIRGEGLPVVFIQGVGLHGRGWSPQIDVLSARYRCLSFDNRGMAQSQPVGETLTASLMAADVVALLDAAGIEAAHLVGHSMGGVIAVETALAHRSRVSSLALLNTVARGADSTSPRKEMLVPGLRTMVGTKRMRRLAFLEMIMPAAALASRDRDALAEELAPIFGHDLGERPPVVMAQLAALANYDATARLPELSGLRTLVVTARHDIVTPPAAGRALAGGIPGARHVEIEDAAHGFPIQHVARANALLEEHLESAASVG